MTKRALLVLIAASLSIAVQADEREDRMAEAKLQADLGHRKQAAEAFGRIANDSAAPAGLRAEALVRLGVCQRAVGDLRGSTESFQRVMVEHGGDSEAVRLVAEAVSGVTPEPARWEQIWRDVRLVVDYAADSPQPTPRIVWPMEGRDSEGGTPCGAPAGAPTGLTVSLDMKDADLGDVLRLFADITGLNVVAMPGMKGRFSARFDDVPWPRALENMLAALGYRCHLDGPVLMVGGSAVMPRTRQSFTGKAIDISYRDEDLVGVLQSVAREGGLRAEVDAGIGGRVTLKLVAVPWDQALDILVLVNGLEWKRDANVVRVRRSQR